MVINQTKTSEREGDHLTIELLWETARLLVTRVSPIYLVDEFIFLFLVLLKEMRTLGKSNIFIFSVSCANQGSEKMV